MNWASRAALGYLASPPVAVVLVTETTAVAQPEDSAAVELDAALALSKKVWGAAWRMLAADQQVYRPQHQR